MHVRQLCPSGRGDDQALSRFPFVTELPTPARLDLPPGTVIAVPANGLTVYRLVTTDPATPADFRPQSSSRAERAGWPELLRLGLSHFLSVQAAEAARTRPGSLIARLTLLPARRIHVAKTGSRREHVTVWAPIEDLLAAAEVVARPRRT